MTCARIALALGVLGTVAVGVILSMGGVTVYGGRAHFRNIRWRLSWWASWASFLVGLALSTFFCGSLGNDQATVNEADARLWHPWLRINRVPRTMLADTLEREGARCRPPCSPRAGDLMCWADACSAGGAFLAQE